MNRAFLSLLVILAPIFGALVSIATSTTVGIEKIERVSTLLASTTPPVAVTSTQLTTTVQQSTTLSQTTPTTTKAEAVTTSTMPTSTTAASTGEFIIPHRIPTQLEEKLESLSCDLPLLPNESRLWNGNETHELLLPFTIPEECPTSSSTSGPPTGDCIPPILSWEGAIEIQSGDVLLVRIDDSHLVRRETINNRTHADPHQHQQSRDRDTQRTSMQEPPTAVYQVTRTGHDNCDVTEGVLLDITPLKVDARKVVTLYDKDLTEGINLLIVVSELWGRQCVRLKVIVKSDNCGENEDCSGKGLCYSNVSMEGYECQCCPGFVGPHCEEHDACYPSPCRNNGICVDITQGHEGSTFQCLCPYGYTGKTCEEETDPCTSMPCQNGANCTAAGGGNVTQFKCDCPKGFAGVHCQHNLNECESSPCVHGICVDQEEGYKCFCQPGYTGLRCEYEYNECESSPCINGGTCNDHVGGYSCSCGRGFTGKRCHIKVDLCEPNPCFEPRYCQDHGNNYSCECPKGFAGPDCLVPSKAACSTNPCANGGTCWSSAESFYCACRAGFTGKTCEDEFVVEKISEIDTASDATGRKLVPQLPMGRWTHSTHLENMQSTYIAVGGAVCTLLIVAAILTACHCRVNKTYKRFTSSVPFWKSCRQSQQARRSHDNVAGVNVGNSEWFSGKDKSLMATPSRSLPSLDTTDMYYTLDFGDSQSSPLIQ